MKKNSQFRKIAEKKDTGTRSIDVYKNGGSRYDVPVDSTDILLQVTTRPEEWLNRNLVIPLGKRDDQGDPIYRVVALKPQYSRSRKKR